MKVIVSGYIGKKITGIAMYLMPLLNNSQSDIKYIVYTNYDMIDELKFTNKNVIVKSYHISKNNSIGNLLWTTFVFPFKGLIEKADIAVIPNFTLLLFKFIKTIVVIHDLIEFNVPDKFSKLKMFYRTKLADPSMAYNSTHIVTVSENSKEDILKYFNVKGNKVSIVYSGIDKDKCKKVSDTEIDEIFRLKHWPKEYMLYAGTVDYPGKNSISVIKAFEMLRAEHDYYGKLIIAGMPGKGFEYIKEYVSNSRFIDDIIITGYITNDELSALYSRCDLFCFLSLYEGFGLPPLEALSYGAKVLVSDRSSLPEVVGDAGWVTDVINTEVIKNSIYFVLNSNKKDSSIIEKQINKFDWKINNKKFEEVLQNC